MKSTRKCHRGGENSRESERRRRRRKQKKNEAGDKNDAAGDSISHNSDPQTVAGWVQEYKGLTFATFRGAGHAVPIFKPSESLAFFSAFINGQSPPFQR